MFGFYFALSCSEVYARAIVSAAIKHTQTLLLQSSVFPEPHILFPSSSDAAKTKHFIMWAQSKRSEWNIIMMGTFFQHWQTSHDIWEPSSKYCFVMRYLASVQSKTLSGGIQVLSISFVPDVFVSTTYIMDELQFLGLINQCLTSMPLVMCSWVDY